MKLWVWAIYLSLDCGRFLFQKPNCPCNWAILWTKLDHLPILQRKFGVTEWTFYPETHCLTLHLFLHFTNLCTVHKTIYTNALGNQFSFFSAPLALARQSISSQPLRNKDYEYTCHSSKCSIYMSNNKGRFYLGFDESCCTLPSIIGNLQEVQLASTVYILESLFTITYLCSNQNKRQHPV